jgi:hypothetical protein
MKQLKTLLLSLSLVFAFSAFNEASAQFMGSELTIQNTVSPQFKGYQVLVDCNTQNITWRFEWSQMSNSAVAYTGFSVPGYFGTPNEVVSFIVIYDAFGNSVTVGAPFSGFPSSAVFPTGDQVDFNYYGCSHPSVIEIY